MISNWKKNPLETNKNEYCTIYTLLFDVDDMSSLTTSKSEIFQKVSL